MVAVIAWLAWAAWIAFFLRRLPPAEWPSVAIVLGVAGGAFGTAVLALEVLRSMSARMLTWSEKKYFRWVGIIFVALFAIQYVGIRMVVSGHVAL